MTRAGEFSAAMQKATPPELYRDMHPILAAIKGANVGEILLAADKGSSAEKEKALARARETLKNTNMQKARIESTLTALIMALNWNLHSESEADTDSKQPAELTEKTTSNEAPKINVKAQKFQEYLASKNIDIFKIEVLNDAVQTVIFRSRIEADGKALPTAIFIDNNAFVIIRTLLYADLELVTQVKLANYLNEVNTKFKIFKYYKRGSAIYLDMCLNFTAETFAPDILRAMLGLLVKHLNAFYGDFLSNILELTKNQA